MVKKVECGAYCGNGRSHICRLAFNHIPKRPHKCCNCRREWTGDTRKGEEQKEVSKVAN